MEKTAFMWDNKREYQGMGFGNKISTGDYKIFTGGLAVGQRFTGNRNF
ncbi:hypothetical protein [Carboxydothermus pertinax]|uniref:Uncharacterized protein n=1 Tax=Carboxydothermus pertinax TaxID=870242 RepID=A0A1L8CRT9_9THEO|nr:hypothetical protein [Carboxydothermus pertinax]GAV21641.1 hypothetical protein cpu_01510 [Carboxydothermus pertinax]